MKKYTVHFNSGNQHDYPSIVVNVVGGMATPEDARRVQEILDSAAKPPAPVVPDGLADELEQCAMVMTYLGATDAGDIDSDTFEILGEDEQGRDAYADVSIVEWAGRTATLLAKIAAAQKGNDQ